MEALKGQEEVDMCEALQEIFDDGKEEGETIGRLGVLLELVKVDYHRPLFKLFQYTVIGLFLA